MRNSIYIYMHGVFKALVNGIMDKGHGGVVYVKGDECAYCFPQDFTDVTFRGKLVEVLEEHGENAFFAVEEKDGKMHLVGYLKERVWKEMVDQK